MRGWKAEHLHFLAVPASLGSPERKLGQPHTLRPLSQCLDQPPSPQLHHLHPCRVCSAYCAPDLKETEAQRANELTLDQRIKKEGGWSLP